MADEAKLRRQQERGIRAKELIENELLCEAFDKLENEIVERFKESKASEKELREDAHRSIRLLAHIRGQLEHTMVTGEAAKRELLNISEKSKIRQFLNQGS